MTKGRFKQNASRNGGTTEVVDLSTELLEFAGSRRFSTVLADPPWRFINRTGKMAPEHRRLSRYGTMTVEDIAALPVAKLLKPTAHLYLWVPATRIRSSSSTDGTAESASGTATVTPPNRRRAEPGRAGTVRHAVDGRRR